MKKWLLVIGVCLLLSGCKGVSEEGDVPSEGTIKIGIMLYRFDDQFISSLMDVMEQEAMAIQEVSGNELHFEFVDARNQQDLQYDQLRKFIEEGYDALAINLVNRSEAAKVIGMAKEADIPVVFFNREPVQEDMARWSKAYYVGTDGKQSGIIQGEIIEAYIKQNPQIDRNEDGVIQYVMLQGQVGHQDAILRSQHSVKYLEEAGFILDPLASDTANWQRAEAQDKMGAWLEIFEGQIELVISNNDAMALGAIDAMKQSGVEIIPTIGVDAIDEAMKAMDKGELIGTVLNDAKAQGEHVIRIAYFLSIDASPTEYVEGIEVGKYLWVPYKARMK